MSIEDIAGLESPNFNEIHDLYDKDDSVKAILFDMEGTLLDTAPDFIVIC